MSLENDEYLAKLDQDISNRNLLTKIQDTIDYFQQELDDKPEEWILKNKNAIIELLDEEWAQIVGNQQIDIAGSYLYEDISTNVADEGYEDDETPRTRLISNMTGGLTGFSRGFGIIYYPTYIGGEFIDDYPKIIHLMYCDPVYDHELQKTVTRMVYSLPDEIRVSLVAESNQDFLEEYTPEVLEDIDHAIYNAANYKEAIQNLGKIKLDQKFADDDLRVALVNYVNKLLNLQSNLPYLISEIDYGFKVKNDNSEMIEDEFPFQTLDAGSDSWLGYITSVNLFNDSELTDEGKVIIKANCQFVISVIVVDGSNESQVHIPLSSKLNIVRIDEVVK